MPNHDDQFDSLPPAIIDALRDLDGPTVLPDRQRDADLLSGARRHLANTAQVDRKRRNLRLFFAGSAGGAIAASVMIAIIVFVSSPLQEPQRDEEFATHTPNTLQPTAARPSDLDQNGTIDILDAYALAKQIHRGNNDPQFDVNDDGLTNQQDIDALANQVVALSTGEQS